MSTNESAKKSSWNGSGFGPKLLDAKEVAETLNVSESWVRDHSQPNGPEPHLPAMKFGTGKTAAVRYHLADLLAFLEQQREAAKARSSRAPWRQ
jgi:hypothetical protein